MGQNRSFPVVGIGASAGGLKSLELFMSVLPESFGFALVFIQHRSPTHDSLLVDLLRSQWPALELLDITDGMEVTPGALYVCPPRVDLHLHEGVFQLRPPEGDRLRLPIDSFLVSLADSVGEEAVAVILSGSGSDGSRGVSAVRGGGGTVLIQDPESAEFPEMPRAALSTGPADAVLAPADLARELVRLHGAAVSGASLGTPMTSDEFDLLCRVLKEKTGHQFRPFKRSMVARRIRRRLAMGGLTSIAAYLDSLATDPSEATLLASDLLIGVTSFFRDPMAWQTLRAEALPRLLASDREPPLRVWTPACATGEEAYSIAMLIDSELEFAGDRREWQIFATEINDPALDRAREGVYPASIAADLPPEYLQRYFRTTSGRQAVVIDKQIREHLVFARHDALADPPFSRMDLVICRNFLIYLEPEAQDRCLTLFHYALKSGGVLFLGSAESVARCPTLFKPLGNDTSRIYRRIGTGASRRIPLGTSVGLEFPPAPASRPNPSVERQPGLVDSVQQALLDEYAPAAVAVSLEHDILYHNGPTHRYLRQPRGIPTVNLLELVPDSLRTRLRGALYRISRSDAPTSVRAILPDDRGRQHPVTIRISRISEDALLVAFRARGREGGRDETTDAHEVATLDEAVVHQLEGELAATRADLQNHIERLSRVNEELQSSNEELQAANEELETSHEELQSLNEELLTVNAQLQSKIEEQSETNSDLNNLLASTSIPTVFLDRHFRVRRFTPAMTGLLPILPSDVGRPLLDLARQGLGPDPIEDARAVLASREPVKREILVDGTWHVRTTLPYTMPDLSVDGVVITYTDVTDQKNVEAALRTQAGLLDLSFDAIFVRDIRGGKDIITFWNHGAQEMYGWSPHEALGTTSHSLLRTEFPQAFEAIRDEVLGEGRWEGELSHTRKNGEPIVVSSRWALQRDASGHPVEILETNRDITVRRRAEREREAVVEFLRLLNANSTTQALVRAATRFFHERSGCEAAAIRLKMGDDFPYWETRGFGPDFVARESQLCTRATNGQCELDSSGDAVLECMCGVVISGRTDPSQPFFTTGGSFWTNSTTEWLACEDGAATAVRVRGRCHREGYESLALIPLRAGTESMGLVQLNDRRGGRFSPEVVALWERLGGYLAMALGRSRALEGLHESETRLRLFVEHAPAALAMFDRSMCYLYASRRWWDDFQLDGTGLTGRSHYEIFPEINEQWKEVHRRAMAGEVVRADADRFERADGSVQYVRWEVRPWHDAAGDVGGIVIFSEDLTDLVDANEAIRRLNQDLARRNEDLESANRELEAFVYSISHDLRAPLRAIAGFATLLAEEQTERLGDAGRRYVERIGGNAEKTATLIDGLLALARTSRQSMARTLVDLSDLARGVVDNLAAAGHARHVQTVVEPGLVVCADPKLMEIALSNLLGNAWKFTAMQAEARIEFGAMEQEGRRTFYVRDNGVGFDAAHAMKMFAPFQRLHADHDFEGTGIGLTIVERIIHRHGGKVWADGAVGEGAVVYFTME